MDEFTNNVKYVLFKSVDPTNNDVNSSTTSSKNYQCLCSQVEVKKEDGSIASMVPIQLGVTTLPTEQVLEEMTSEINKGNEALGLSSPPSEPLPCPVESPNKPIEATLQPQQPLTGEGAAAAVQQSDIPMAGSGCWPQKESDVEVKGLFFFFGGGGRGGGVR